MYITVGATMNKNALQHGYRDLVEVPRIVISIHGGRTSAAAGSHIQRQLAFTIADWVPSCWLRVLGGISCAGGARSAMNQGVAVDA